MTDEQDVFESLRQEGEEIDGLLAGLATDQWHLPTPAPGWTIAHQVAHLSATFRMAGTAAADPAGFREMTSRLSEDFDANVAHALAGYLIEPPPVLLARFREERAGAGEALAAVPPGQPIPWLVNPLPAPVLAAAGMMELFGHGQDIADTLGVRRERTGRLRHLAEFAARTRDFGYLARGLQPPAGEFRFTLTAPAGDTWVFGPEDAEHEVSGPAEDFCLLVTRRRHRDDLALSASDTVADHWLDIAQAYRGPAGPGRAPGGHQADLSS